MLRCSHKTLIFISGAIWLAVGVFLLQLGLNLLFERVDQVQPVVVPQLAALTKTRENAMVLLFAIALMIGNLKGRFVLSKAAQKGINRIHSLPQPQIHQIYNARYYILLGAMMGLGLSIKWLGIPTDIRGVIDIAIGCALIRGSLVYFRSLFELEESKASEFKK